MVRAKGVEPSLPREPEPKSGASTNSATRASKKTSNSVLLRSKIGTTIGTKTTSQTISQLAYPLKPIHRPVAS